MKSITKRCIFISVLFLTVLFSRKICEANENYSEVFLRTESIKTSGNYQYKILSEMEKTIALYKILNYSDVVEIPERIDGYSVVSLGLPSHSQNIFRQDNEEIKIKKLVIPDSVKRIEDGACRELKYLTELKLPKGVEIGNEVFVNCKMLKKLELEKVSLGYCAFDGVSLDELIFNGKNSLVSITDEEIAIGGHIKNVYYRNVGDEVFVAGFSADNVYIPKTVKKVALWAVRANNIYIPNKEAKIDIHDKRYIEGYKHFVLSKGSKAIKKVQQCKTSYTVIDNSPKIAIKKKKDKKKTQYVWKITTPVKTDYVYKKKKWCKTRSYKANYKVYFKKKGSKKFQYRKTTKKKTYDTNKPGTIKIKIIPYKWMNR